MVWKVTIVDDEVRYIDRIKKIIGSYLEERLIEYEICTYVNAEQFLEELPQMEDCYLFLLDMQVSGYTGLQLAKEVRRNFPEPYIIFITNYMEYAADAFEVNAFRYISKNQLEEKLPLALDWLNGRRAERFERGYTIETGFSCEHILLRNIYYLQKQGKYVRIVHRFGESKVRKTLRDIYEELNSEDFIFTDKSYIVNMMHILKYKKNFVYMSNQTEIPVSIPRAAEFRQSFAAYCERYKE